MLIKKIKKNILFKDIKALVWDLDGTLYQNFSVGEAMEKEFLKFFNKHCFTVTIEEFRELSKKHGSWSRTITENSSLKNEIKIIDQIEDILNKHRFLNKDPGLVKAIEELSSFKHIILTNSRKKDVLLCLKAIGFKKKKESYHPFEEIIARDTEGKLKPSVDLLKKVIDLTGLKKSEHLMIGDSFHSDIEPATNFGFKAIHIDKFKKIIL
jgi:HAD superfamily hydrolase (TIGR01549 family)